MLEMFERRIEKFMEKLDEMASWVCDGGTLQFVQCMSAQGEAGRRLREEIEERVDG